MKMRHFELLKESTWVGTTTTTTTKATTTTTTTTTTTMPPTTTTTTTTTTTGTKTTIAKASPVTSEHSKNLLHCSMIILLMLFCL